MSEFFHMGGYAFYVWGAYGAAAVLLTADFLAPMLKLKQLRAALARRRKRHELPPS
jgi:heme exporter protein D